MQFINTEDLQKGMRLAKPIFNKNGIMLYDRDTKLTKQGINSIRNFKLIGIYILEPAEPLPPMTEDDKEFERFQTMNIFGIKEDMDLLILRKRPFNTELIAKRVFDSYGKKKFKINFQQNLRSEDDSVYKHAMNTAILSAVMSSWMNLPKEEIYSLIQAALLAYVGRYAADVEGTQFENERDYALKTCQRSNRMISDSEDIRKDVKDIITDRYRLETGNRGLKDSPLSVKILQVAQAYDDMTAMSTKHDPLTEVSAIRHFLTNTEKYDISVISALVSSIRILYPGTCVELTNGEMGIVVKANNIHVLRPVVLGFTKNTIFDLGDEHVFKKVQIIDIMKTMDRRIKIDQKVIDEYIKMYNF